jgi:hypothetical protein
VVSFAANEAVAHQGDEATHFGVVLSGTIHAFVLAMPACANPSATPASADPLARPRFQPGSRAPGRPSRGGSLGVPVQ